MDRKNNPSSMFFVVVVYTFHIDPSFKAFVSNVVLRATNMSRALLECECLYCAMKLMVFSSYKHVIPESSRKKENRLDQVQIKMKIQLDLLNSQGIQVSKLIIINLFWSLFLAKNN